MRLVTVIAELGWAIGNIHKAIEKALGSEYRFRYFNSANFIADELRNAIYECDIVLTTLNLHTSLFDFLGGGEVCKKIALICHGYPELFAIESGASNLFNYGATSPVIIPQLKSKISNTIYITPNGVEPADFTYVERSGSIKTIGWCGCPDVGSKRYDWGIKIAQKSNLPISLAMSLSSNDIKKWYHKIDILIVTSGPEITKETGPLPPFEAIVSGVLIIGTIVGNFSYVPGPKFETIEEAVDIINRLKSDPDEVKRLAKEQYDWVMNNWTYDILKKHWIQMFDDIIIRTQGTTQTDDVDDVDDVEDLDLYLD